MNQDDKTKFVKAIFVEGAFEETTQAMSELVDAKIEHGKLYTAAINAMSIKFEPIPEATPETKAILKKVQQKLVKEIYPASFDPLTDISVPMKLLEDICVKNLMPHIPEGEKPVTKPKKPKVAVIEGLGFSAASLAAQLTMLSGHGHTLIDEVHQEMLGLNVDQVKLVDGVLEEFTLPGNWFQETKNFLIKQLTDMSNEQFNEVFDPNNRIHQEAMELREAATAQDVRATGEQVRQESTGDASGYVDKLGNAVHLGVVPKQETPVTSVHTGEVQVRFRTEEEIEREPLGFPIKRVRGSGEDVSPISLEEDGTRLQDHYAGFDEYADELRAEQQATFANRTKRVWKEKVPGVYSTDDGWCIKEAQHEKADEYDDGIRWTMYNSAGEQVEVTKYIWHFEDKGYGKLYSFHSRKDRNPANDHGLKFGAAHFPIGTQFQVDSSVMYKETTAQYKPTGFTQDVFTVSHLSYNGPRSVLVHTLEQRRGIGEARYTLEPHQYNLSHVRKILSRPKDTKVVIDDCYRARFTGVSMEEWLVKNRKDVQSLFGENLAVMPKVRRGEVVLHNLSSIATYLLEEQGEYTQNASKWLDEERLYKHMRAMGLMRMISVPDEDSKDRRFNWHFYAVNVSKLRKWLKKNAHRVMHNLDYCEKREQEETNRYLEEVELD